MAINRLKMAHERQKVKLRGQILQKRVRIEEEKQALGRMRSELKSLKPTKAS